MLRKLLLSGLILIVAVPASAEVANRVILRVNDRIATLYDYQQALGEQLRLLRNQGGLAPDERQRRREEAGQAVMRALFDDLLMLSRGDQLGVAISEGDVERAVDNMKARAGVETEEQFRNALMQSGMTPETFRQQMRRQLMRNEVTQREILPRLEIEDETLRRIYRENPEEFSMPERRRLEEIVVLEATVPDDGARTRIAGEVVEAVQAGESPEAVADRLGEQATRIDLGWVEPGELAAELEGPIWQLAAGDVSAPIAARGGLHVIKILELSEQTVRPFEDVRDAILRFERERRFVIEEETYLRELEAEAYIVGEVPPEAAGFRTSTGRPILKEDNSLFGGLPESLASPDSDDPESASAELSDADETEEAEPPNLR